VFARNMKALDVPRYQRSSEQGATMLENESHGYVEIETKKEMTGAAAQKFAGNAYHSKVPSHHQTVRLVL
jgi:hypothetical protein